MPPSKPEIVEKPLIICYGHDQMLLNSRRWLLETRFRVDVSSNLTSLRAWLMTGSGCDLVILCHSLEPGEAQEAYDLIRKTSAKTKILELLCRAKTSSSTLRDEELSVSDGPRAFLDKVSEMLGTRRTSGEQKKRSELLPFRVVAR